MCQFETPIFIYYSYITIFLLSLITAFIILFKNPKHPTNQNAFYFILIILAWIANDFVQWIVLDMKINMFSARISYLSNFIFLFYLYFCHYFTYTPIDLKKKILLAAPFVISGIITLFSNFHFVISDYDPISCNYVPGANIYISYVLNLVYAYLATRVLLKSYHKRIMILVTKCQIKVLISAVWLFAIWCIVYEEIGKISYEMDSFVEISPHFIIGNLFFVSLIAFAIIKKDLFEFENVFLNWFTIFLWSLLFVGLFVFAGSPGIIILCTIAYLALMLTFLGM